MTALTPRMGMRRFLSASFTSLFTVAAVMTLFVLPDTFAAKWLFLFACVFICFLSVWRQYYAASPKLHWWRQVVIASMIIATQSFFFAWNFWLAILIWLTILVPWFIIRHIRTRRRSW